MASLGSDIISALIKIISDIAAGQNALPSVRANAPAASLMSGMMALDQGLPSWSHLPPEQLAAALFRRAFVDSGADSSASNKIVDYSALILRNPGENANDLAPIGKGACMEMLSQYAIAGQSSTAAAFLVACSSAGLQIDISALGMLGGSYRASGRISALEGLRLCVPPELRSGPGGLDAQLLSAYADMGLADDAAGLLRTIARNGVPLTARHVDSLLLAFGAAHDLPAAWRLVRDMALSAVGVAGAPLKQNSTALPNLPRPDIGTINTLIHVCGVCNEPDRARLLFETLAHCDVTHALATGRLAEQREDDSPERTSKLASSGVISAVAGRILRGYVTGGSGAVPTPNFADAAATGIASLTFLGSSIGTALYGGVGLGSSIDPGIRAQSTVASLESLSLYELLSRAGDTSGSDLAPTLHTYGALVQAYAAAGRSEEAIAAFSLLEHRMSTESGSDGVSNYPRNALEAVLEARAGLGDIAGVQKCLELCRKMGIACSGSVLGSAMEVVGRTKGAGAACEALDSLRTACPSPLTALCLQDGFLAGYARGLGAGQSPADVIRWIVRLLHEMRNSSHTGIDISKTFAGVLLRVACQAGDMDVVCSLLSRFNQDGVAPTPQWYEALEQCKGKSGELTLMLSAADTFGIFRAPRTACRVGAALSCSGKLAEAASLLQSVAAKETAPVLKMATSIFKAVQFCSNVDAPDLPLLLDSLIGASSVSMALAAAEASQDEISLVSHPDALMEAQFTEAMDRLSQSRTLCRQPHLVVLEGSAASLVRARAKLESTGFRVLSLVIRAMCAGIVHAGTYHKDSALALDRYDMLVRLVRGYPGCYASLLKSFGTELSSAKADLFQLRRAVSKAADCASEPYAALMHALLACKVAGVPVAAREIDTFRSTYLPYINVSADNVLGLLTNVLQAMAADGLPPGPHLAAVVLQYAVPLGFVHAGEDCLSEIVKGVTLAGGEGDDHPGSFLCPAGFSLEAEADGRGLKAIELLQANICNSDAIIRLRFIVAAHTRSGSLVPTIWRTFMAHKRALAADAIVSMGTDRMVADALPGQLCEALGVPFGTCADTSVLEAASTPASLFTLYLQTLAAVVSPGTPLSSVDQGSPVGLLDPHAAVEAIRSALAARCASGQHVTIQQLSFVTCVYSLAGLRADARLLLRLTMAPFAGKEYANADFSRDMKADSAKLASTLNSIAVVSLTLPAEDSLRTIGISEEGVAFGAPEWRAGGNERVKAVVATGALSLLPGDVCALLIALGCAEMSEDIEGVLSAAAYAQRKGQNLLCRRAGIAAYSAFASCGMVAEADRILSDERFTWGACSVVESPLAGLEMSPLWVATDAIVDEVSSSDALNALRVIGLCAAGKVLPAARQAEIMLSQRYRTGAPFPMLAVMVSSLLESASSVHSDVLVASPGPDAPITSSRAPYVQAKQMLGEDEQIWQSVEPKSDEAIVATRSQNIAGDSIDALHGGLASASVSLLARIEGIGRAAARLNWRPSAQDAGALVRLYAKARDTYTAVHLGWSFLDSAWAAGSTSSTAGRGVLGGEARLQSLRRYANKTPMQGSRGSSSVDAILQTWVIPTARPGGGAGMALNPSSSPTRSKVQHPGPAAVPFRAQSIIFVSDLRSNQHHAKHALAATTASASVATSLLLALAAAPAEAYEREFIGPDAILATYEAAQQLNLQIGSTADSLASIIRSRMAMAGGVVDAPLDIAEVAGYANTSTRAIIPDVATCGLEYLPFRLFSPQCEFGTTASLQLGIGCSPSAHIIGTAVVSLLVSIGFEHTQGVRVPDTRSHCVYSLARQARSLAGAVLPVPRFLRNRVQLVLQVSEMAISGLPSSQVAEAGALLPSEHHVASHANFAPPAAQYKNSSWTVAAWPTQYTSPSFGTLEVASRGDFGVLESRQGTHGAVSTAAAPDVLTGEHVQLLETEVLVLGMELDQVVQAAKVAEQTTSELQSKYKLINADEEFYPSRQSGAFVGTASNAPLAQGSLLRSVTANSLESRLKLLNVVLAELQLQEKDATAAVGADSAARSRYSAYSAGIEAFSREEQELLAALQAAEQSQLVLEGRHAEAAASYQAAKQTLQKIDDSCSSSGLVNVPAHSRGKRNLAAQRVNALEPLVMGPAAVAITRAQTSRQLRAETARLQFERQCAADVQTANVAATLALARKLERKVDDRRAAVSRLSLLVDDAGNTVNELAEGEAHVRGMVASLRDNLQALQMHSQAVDEAGVPSEQPFRTAAGIVARAHLALDSARARHAVDRRMALADVVESGMASVRSQGEIAVAEMRSRQARLAESITLEFRRKCDDANLALTGALQDELQPVMQSAQEVANTAAERRASLERTAADLEAELEALSSENATLSHSRDVLSGSLAPRQAVLSLGTAMDELLEELLVADDGPTPLVVLQELEYTAEGAAFGAGEAESGPHVSVSPGSGPSSPGQVLSGSRRARLDPRAYVDSMLSLYEAEMGRLLDSAGARDGFVRALSDMTPTRTPFAGSKAGSISSLRSRTSISDPDIPAYLLGVGPSGARPLVRASSSSRRSASSYSGAATSVENDADAKELALLRERVFAKRLRK